MDKMLGDDKRLLFKHEVLRSRLDIRDFFLKNAVREVFENIGQVLSVVRMQLAVLDSDNGKSTDGNLNSSGQLVGQSIRDLRAMCRSFYPDSDILAENGLVEAFQSTLEILFEYSFASIKIKGVRKDLQPELKLIVFKMVQEILISIKEAGRTFIGLIISYAKDSVHFNVHYTGEEIRLDKGLSSDGVERDLTLQQRAQLIKAKFLLGKNKAGKNTIKLITPLKINFYE